MTKKCVLCKQDHPLRQFNKRAASADGLQNVCRECNKTRSRAYYSGHKKLHILNVGKVNARHRMRNRDYIVSYLKGKSCIDCGESDLRLMVFDHRPGTKKINGVARLAAIPAPIDRVIEEINKCDIRCHNCHFLVTYERLGGTWHDAYLAGVIG